MMKVTHEISTVYCLHDVLVELTWENIEMGESTVLATQVNEEDKEKEMKRLRREYKRMRERKNRIDENCELTNAK